MVTENSTPTLATPKRPIVVFATSEVHDSLPDGKKIEGREPDGIFMDRGREEFFYSTGRIERAQALRYEVFVVSTRETTSSHDEWWVKLVGEDHVFMTPNREVPTSEDEERQYPESNDEGRYRHLLPWRTLFERLGKLFPETHSWCVALRHDLPVYGIDNLRSFLQVSPDPKPAI